MDGCCMKIIQVDIKNLFSLCDMLLVYFKSGVTDNIHPKFA